MSGVPTLTVAVDTSDRKGTIRTIEGLPATYTEIHYMKDAFKGLLGDAQARVSIGLDEKFPGPSGTYSSVGIRISVTVSCDQSKESIDKTTELAFDYASDFLDRHAVTAVRLLNKHFDAVYPPDK